VNTNSPTDTGAIVSAINELGAPAVLALLQTVSECKLRGETFHTALRRTRDELQTSAYLLFEPDEVAALTMLLEACASGSFPFIVITALAAEAQS
jgi:hypothetical protein